MLHSRENNDLLSLPECIEIFLEINKLIRIKLKNVLCNTKWQTNLIVNNTLMIQCGYYILYNMKSNIWRQTENAEASSFHRYH